MVLFIKTCVSQVSAKTGFRDHVQRLCLSLRALQVNTYLQHDTKDCSLLDEVCVKDT